MNDRHLDIYDDYLIPTVSLTKEQSKRIRKHMKGLLPKNIHVFSTPFKKEDHMELKSRLKDNRVYGCETKVDDIWILNDKRVCCAVHPDHPHLLIYGGNARGRKIHLDKGDEIHTVCNMLVDEYVPANEDSQPCMVLNGKCKICFKDNQ